MTTREAAEKIIATYDSADQFAAVATNGCGEWELDRAVEMSETDDSLTASAITAEVERLCREKCEADDEDDEDNGYWVVEGRDDGVTSGWSVDSLSGGPDVRFESEEAAEAAMEQLTTEYDEDDMRVTYVSGT